MLVDRDAEHLRLLGIYHMVFGAFSLIILLLFVLAPLIIGPSFYSSLHVPVPDPALLRKQLLTGLLAGGLQVFVYVMNGWCLYRHRNRMSAIVMSIAECLSIPIGLVLGLSAIIVLRRDTVKELFNRNKPQA